MTDPEANSHRIEEQIGKELSLVPEVEFVFVERDQDAGQVYKVTTVINDRDPDVREKVYAREEVIIDKFSGVGFSFSVISRMNRPLTSVITPSGKLAFQR